jgi:hypothetical protein
MPALSRAAKRATRAAHRTLPHVAAQRERESQAASLIALELQAYQFRAEDYIRDKLGWTPWRGTPDRPGQMEVIEAYNLALRQQFERAEFEAGTRTKEDLRWWRPGQVIQNWLRAEAGHGVGKTKLGAGLTNHFFDCFLPSVGYCFAPTEAQIKDLLFAQIKEDRRDKGLPGRIMELELRRGDNHWVKGKVASNADNRGTERVQGKHGKFWIFVLDEAEGIDAFLWKALQSLTSGGIGIVLMFANPRTRTSHFHKVRVQEHVRSFRISCLHHPNVVEGRELVPGAITRGAVEQWMAGGVDGNPHATVADRHDEDKDTFELPFTVRIGGVNYPPGTVFEPDAELMFRVLGKPPANLADNTFVPSGRYEKAKERGSLRVFPPEPTHRARMGVDCARFGNDAGTLYVRWNGRVWRAARFPQLRTDAYLRGIRDAARWLHGQGVTSLHIRIDAGGGYGGGVADLARMDMEFLRWFPDFLVLEVHAQSPAHNGEAYADQMTELYAQAGETLKAVAIVDPADTLEQDLTERMYDWVNDRGREVKVLEPKKAFKKRARHSPDDGDGCVLALAPDFVFQVGGTTAPPSSFHYPTM